MPVSVDITLAEMLAPGGLYTTQRMTTRQPAVGGRQVSNLGRDQPVRARGVPSWKGTNALAAGDRASYRTTGQIEALLMRMMRPGIKFANPIIRPNMARLWAFRGDRAGDTVVLDSQLCNSYLTASADATVAADGTYSVGVDVTLRQADATLSDLEVTVQPGALCSAGGKLFMVTRPVDWGTELRGLEPLRGIGELADDARIEWLAPWLACRLPVDTSIDMPRAGASAGPYAYEWEEAD